MSKLIVTLIFVAAVVVAGPAGCSRERSRDALRNPEKIILAVVPWPGSASLYVAHEKGYFRKEGLDAALHSYVSGQPCIDAALSGKADFAAAGDTPVVQTVIEDKPVTVIATLCEIDRPILIVARKDRAITSAKDLAGKRVGVAKGTTADFFLHIFLTTSFVPLRDVRVLNFAPNQVVDALVRGEVDAVSTWYPHTITAMDKLGDNAVAFDDPSIYKMTWNLITSQELVEKYPERIKKVLAAILRANQFIRERPGETRTICSKYNGTGKPVSEKDWKSYKFTAALDETLILTLEDQARWMIKSEASGKSVPNFSDFIYTSGLKALRPEAVGVTGK